MSAHTSECEPSFIEYIPPPQTDEGRPPKALRDRVRLELRDLLDHVIQMISNGRQKGMRYTPEGYARGIVVKYGYRLVGWPSEIPFGNLSDIGGGAGPLLELLRRWKLPEEDPERLRFERASEEEIARAAVDPDSVHPNQTKLEEQRQAAAEAAAEEAGTETAAAAPQVVLSDVFHPDGLDFVGIHPTSTDPHAAGIGSDQQAQRIDMGRRRRRAVDTSGETRLRKLPAKRGITTPRFVLAECQQPTAEEGERGQGGGDGERAAKRARLETRELAVDDPIDQFALSRAFGGAAGGIDEVLLRFRA